MKLFLKLTSLTIILWLFFCLVFLNLNLASVWASVKCFGIFKLVFIFIPFYILALLYSGDSKDPK